MKIRAFTKDIYRSIAHSWSRFWAIFAIVALGSGFYAGLRATAPDMRATADAYFDDANMMDIRLLSAFGFSEEDVEEIRKIPGVKGVMAGHTADALFLIEEKEQAVRVHSLPENLDADNEEFLNRPVLAEGRMPEKPGECLIGKNKAETGIQLGDTITIAGEDWENSFRYRSFKVVGLVDSPYYISFSLGSTSIGTGSLNRYMYIRDEDFSQEAITDLYVTVEGAAEKSTFSQSYKDTVQEVKDALKALGEKRDDIRYEEVVADSRETLEQGWKDYTEAENETRIKLAEGEEDLMEAEALLEEKRAELQAGRLEYENGRAQWEENNAEYTAARQAYEDGRAQWLSGYSEYIAGLQNYSDGMQALREGKQQLSEAEAQITAGERQLENTKGLYESAKNLRDILQQQTGGTAPSPSEPGESSSIPPISDGSIEDIIDQIGGLTPDQAAGILSGLNAETLAALSSYLDETILTYEKSAEELKNAKIEFEKQKAENGPKLEAAEKELSEAAETLAAAKGELDSTKGQLEAAKRELDSAGEQLKNGEKTLIDSEKTLKNGEAQLETAEGELKDNRLEFDKQKEKAEKELSSAKKELEEGQRKLDEIDIPEWYILGRETNMGYASFDADAGRMDSLSAVFPVLFFLVAALVALTTMTRMVEEERGMIGAYKALGYSGGRIAWKYLCYAGLASVTGSVAGVCLGFAALPPICWNAYRMMYTAPDLINEFNWLHAGIGCIASIACTLGATLASCYSSLSVKPSALMQPKAPKKGKRILLERLPFIWKRLKFSNKVTFRNLFRYKRRLIMTIVGISGCTALVLTGFGIKDSISHIVSDQFDSVYSYNLTITLKDGDLSKEAESLLNDTKKYSGWMKALKKMGDVSAGNETVSGYVFVPEHTEQLKSFIKLQDRRTHEDVPFEENSVIVTEKLANMLGISTGDSISLENSSGTRKLFTVTGITENYVYHYVYVAPALYEKTMGEKPVFTEIEAVSLLTEEDEAEREDAAQALLEDESVSTVSYSSDMKNGFEDMVRGLNTITLVMIGCAGALAFVVLYNLTNINVAERQRELATIKVLGFFNREVSAYIYRETTLLTVLGCALGLVFGVAMNSFIIQTVEVDLVMFPRTIDPISFVWSALITMVFSAVVDLFMSKKLRKIDMVESLKSVE